MIQTADQRLDSDELLYLALDANRRGRTEDSLITLKRTIDAAPNDTRIHYVMGSIYNQIGLIERAEKHLQHATTFDPAMESARFELDWLYWSTGHADTAAQPWKAFDDSGKEHPLYLFKTVCSSWRKANTSSAKRIYASACRSTAVNIPYGAEMA